VAPANRLGQRAALFGLKPCWAGAVRGMSRFRVWIAVKAKFSAQVGWLTGLMK
jgi:hypothetical protein